MKKMAIVMMLAGLFVLTFGAVGCKKKADQPLVNHGDDAEYAEHEGHEGHEEHEGRASRDAAATSDTPLKNGFEGMPPEGTKAFCPVMKTEFQVSSKTESSQYKGKTYVFCCSGCKPKFEETPEAYL